MRKFRLAVLCVLVVVVQVAVFPHLRAFGVVPDLGLVLALAVGYHEGPEAGVVVGFVTGLGFDLFLITPLGLNALTYALMGYAVGVVESGMLRSPRLLSVLLALVGGLVGGLVLISIGVLAGVDAVKGFHGVRTIGIAALYDAVLAPALFFVVSRALGESTPVRGPWPIV